MAIGPFVARCLLVSTFLTLGVSILADHTPYSANIGQKYNLSNSTLMKTTGFQIPFAENTIAENSKLILGAVAGLMVSSSLLVILDVKLGMMILLSIIAGVNAFVHNPLMYDDPV